VPVVALDAGNFFDLPTEKGRMQTKILVEAMDELGYDVVNVGEREVRLGWDNLQEFVGEAEFRLVSANFVNGTDQKPVFDPHTVIDVPREKGKPVRVGVVGAVRFNSLFEAKGPNDVPMKIVHPLEAVRGEVAALQKKKVDLIVFLAAMPLEDASRIVEEVPGIDFVFGAFGGRVTLTAERVGTTEIVYLDNRGQRVGETRVFLQEQGGVGSATTVHHLGRQYPDDPAMAEFVARRLEAARPAPSRPAPAVQAPPPPAEPARPLGAYVGSEECSRCHSGPHRQWQDTGHSHALDTLRAAGKASEAACVSCHVTGFGQGGFVDADETPQLAAVGCESCHGPGRAHLVNLAAPYGAVDVATCTRCHDRANDPDFDYYALLPRVTHGATQAAASAP
jgi:hypothetical protein